jgi:hypothetical protein
MFMKMNYKSRKLEMSLSTIRLHATHNYSELNGKVVDPSVVYKRAPHRPAALLAS